MIGLLLLVLLLVLLFGALGVALSPLFFILLVAVLLIAGVGGRGRCPEARRVDATPPGNPGQFEDRRASREAAASVGLLTRYVRPAPAHRYAGVVQVRRP